MTSIQSGDADAPTKDMSNWNAIRNIVNGDLGNVNFGSSDPLAISKTALGTYTAWATWAPTLTSASGTWTGTSAPIARWTQIGKTVIFQIHTTGTAGTTPSALLFTLPATPANNTDLKIAGGCLCVNSGAVISGTYRYNGTTVEVKLYNEGAWSNGTDGFSFNAAYEVA